MAGCGARSWPWTCPRGSSQRRTRGPAVRADLAVAFHGDVVAAVAPGSAYAGGSSWPTDVGEGDESPQMLAKIEAADILIIGTSIWFGVRNACARW